MKKNLKSPALLMTGITTYILLGGSCLPQTSIPARGVLNGKPIDIKVDSRFAKMMLSDPGHDSVLALYQTYGDHKLNTHTLAEITNTYSADVATLYFLQKAYESKKNQEAQQAYHKFFELQQANNEIDLGPLEEYHVVFIPGLAYKQDTTTGANFARQIQLLNRLNVSNELIETDEWGLVDDNAQIIVGRLKDISKNYPRIMIVSASKGGLETAIALGDIMTPDESQAISSWVSVGGILRGSPVADTYLKAPKCWFAEFMLWTKDSKIDLVTDMSYKIRQKTFDELNFPDHLKIIHFVGVPLASQISNEIKNRYCSIKELGPNDGLTPIADEVTEEGIIISEIGLDHYYRDAEIDKKTLALALVATEIP